MRISDWSSDVCSSDLQADRPESAWRRAVSRRRRSLQVHRQDGGHGVGRADLRNRLQDAPRSPLSGSTRRLHRSLSRAAGGRSEEHTSELQSLMRISYAAFCLNKKKINETI